jgi:hypothetical protein
MYSWYYVWSDLYRVFHEVLQFGTRDLSGVALKPICMPQSIFNKKTEDANSHFLTGIAIKLHCICKILQGTKDPYIIFSDVDLIVNDKNLVEKVKAYEGNDITAMRDLYETDQYNIGFLLIKNTPEVLQFFQCILKRTFEEKKLDQDVFNEEIQTFKGTHGFFDPKHFIQSNMIRKDIWDVGNYSIIQCLSSAHGSMKEVILGKLATIVYFYDIRYLVPFIERETMNDLQDYMKQTNPVHYLCSLDLDALYAPPSPAKELPKDA